MEPASHCFRDAADRMVPQQELFLFYSEVSFMSSNLVFISPQVSHWNFFSFLFFFFFFFFFFFSFFFFFFFFLLFRAALAAHGGSQARDPMGAVAASPCHSHSNAGSELRLQPTPELTATPDP